MWWKGVCGEGGCGRHLRTQTQALHPPPDPEADSPLDPEADTAPPSDPESHWGGRYASYWNALLLLPCRLKGKLNTVARDYVLPDYTSVKRGYMRPLEETTGRAKGDEQVRNLHWAQLTISGLIRKKCGRCNKTAFKHWRRSPLCSWVLVVDKPIVSSVLLNVTKLSHYLLNVVHTVLFWV